MNGIRNKRTKRNNNNKKMKNNRIERNKKKSKYNSIYFVVAGDAWVAEVDGRIAVAAWLRNCV